MTADAVDIYKAFAEAYGDPTSLTYNNAKRTYILLHPDTNETYAGQQGSRMLNDERTVAHLHKFRQTARAMAAITAEEYLVFGWETLQRAAVVLEREPKALAGFAKLYEAVGKAGGFLISKHEDVTPLEKKMPISAGEAKTLLEARLEKLKRIDQPNPLPSTATAKLAPPVVEDADFTIIDPATTDAKSSDNE